MNLTNNGLWFPPVGSSADAPAPRADPTAYADYHDVACRWAGAAPRPVTAYGVVDDPPSSPGAMSA